jgi:hypothetical protein
VVAGGGDDDFDIGPNVPVAINGNVEIHGGDGDNDFDTGLNLGGGAAIRGNLTYNGGFDSDTVFLDTAVISGDVVVHLGDGFYAVSVSYNTNTFYAGFYGHVNISGNLTVTSTGSADVDVDIDSTIVGGDVNLLLADGENNLTLGTGNNVGSNAINDQVIFFNNLNISTGDDDDVVISAPRIYIDDEVTLSLGGGEDQVFFGGTVGSDSDSASLVIDTGSGDDSVTVDQVRITGDLVVNLGDGNNYLTSGYYGTVFVREDLVITAGSGNDTINIDDTTVGSDAFLSLGDGNALVEFSPADNANGINDATVIFGNLTIITGASAGGSVIQVGDNQQTVVQGNLTVVADIGGPAALVQLGVSSNGRAFIGGDVAIATGSGQDGVTIDSTTVSGDVTVNLGDGATNFFNSAAYYGTTTIGGDLTVVGGIGNEIVDLDSLTVGQSVSLLLGDGDNSLLIGEADNPTVNNPVVIFGSLIVGTGAGNDNVFINSGQLSQVFVADSLNLNLGASSDLVVSFADVGTDAFGGATQINTAGGADSITLGGTSQRRLEVILGDGDDTITYDAGFTLANLGVFSGLADGGNGALDANNDGALNPAIAAQIVSVRFELPI